VRGRGQPPKPRIIACALALQRGEQFKDDAEALRRFGVAPRTDVRKAWVEDKLPQLAARRRMGSVDAAALEQRARQAFDEYRALCSEHVKAFGDDSSEDDAQAMWDNIVSGDDPYHEDVHPAAEIDVFTSTMDAAREAAEEQEMERPPFFLPERCLGCNLFAHERAADLATIGLQLSPPSEAFLIWAQWRELSSEERAPHVRRHVLQGRCCVCSRNLPRAPGANRAHGAGTHLHAFVCCLCCDSMCSNPGSTAHARARELEAEGYEIGWGGSVGAVLKDEV
jgi:hypothetical protein